MEQTIINGLTLIGIALTEIGLISTSMELGAREIVLSMTAILLVILGLIEMFSEDK